MLVLQLWRRYAILAVVMMLFFHDWRLWLLVGTVVVFVVPPVAASVLWQGQHLSDGLSAPAPHPPLPVRLTLVLGIHATAPAPTLAAAGLGQDVPVLPP